MVALRTTPSRRNMHARRSMSICRIVLFPILAWTLGCLAYADDAAQSSTLRTSTIRTWSDPSGSFTVEASLVETRGSVVVLRKTDGSEIKVPLSRLSTADQKFVRQHAASVAALEEQLQSIADAFYQSLREPDRTAAGALLTTDAQRFLNTKPSHLDKLPTPDPGKRSIRISAPEIDGGIAEVPVRVRVQKAMHSTKLHLRQDSDGWRIFALSARYPDGERSIEFESEPETPDEKRSLIGQTMPLSGITQFGQPLNLQDYAGKFVLVDFWATWCGPCRAEMPNILENYRKYHDQGFEVIAISLDRNMESLEKFLAEEKPPWTVVADRHPNNKVSMAARYQVRSIPSMFLIGPDGKVVAENCRGKRLGAELEKRLR